MPDEGYMDAAGIDTPDAGDDTPRHVQQPAYWDATAAEGTPPRPAPDAGDSEPANCGLDALRERLAETLFYTAPNGKTIFRWADPAIALEDDPHLADMLDALLPAIREHTAAWDTLRLEIAAALILHDHPEQNALTRPDDPLVMLRADPKFHVCSKALAQADALLPTVREHVAAAVQAERERAAKILNGCNERNAKLTEELDDYQGRYETAHESFLASERDRDVAEAGRRDEKEIANAALAAAAKEQQRAETAEAAIERERERVSALLASIPDEYYPQDVFGGPLSTDESRQANEVLKAEGLPTYDRVGANAMRHAYHNAARIAREEATDE